VRAVALALVAGVAIGAGAMWLAGPADPPPRAGRTPADQAVSPVAPVEAPHAGRDHEAELAELRAELALERSLRETLSAELADLEEGLARDEEGDSARAAAGAARPGAPPARPPSSRPDEQWFEPSSLADLGYRPSEIDRIRDAWGRAVMRRLELETERTRSGETGAHAAHRDAMQVAEQAREELGDDDYDAMLYAAGEPNRVILSALIESAPAAAAGALVGDEVISYSGERVFRPRELKQLISNGEPGAQVELRVRRAGEVRRIFLPRGPLGARLVFESRPPER